MINTIYHINYSQKKNMKKKIIRWVYLDKPEYFSLIFYSLFQFYLWS
jgi:hypothetical protein